MFGNLQSRKVGAFAKASVSNLGRGSSIAGSFAGVSGFGRSAFAGAIAGSGRGGSFAAAMSATSGTSGFGQNARAGAIAGPGGSFAGAMAGANGIGYSAPMMGGSFAGATAGAGGIGFGAPTIGGFGGDSAGAMAGAGGFDSNAYAAAGAGGAGAPIGSPQQGDPAYAAGFNESYAAGMSYAQGSQDGFQAGMQAGSGGDPNALAAGGFGPEGGCPCTAGQGDPYADPYAMAGIGGLPPGLPMDVGIGLPCDPAAQTGFGPDGGSNGADIMQMLMPLIGNLMGPLMSMFGGSGGACAQAGANCG